MDGITSPSATYGFLARLPARRRNTPPRPPAGLPRRYEMSCATISEGLQALRRIVMVARDENALHLFRYLDFLPSDPATFLSRRRASSRAERCHSVATRPQTRRRSQPIDGKPPRWRGLREMGGTGLVPMTPSLSTHRGRSRPFVPVRQTA